MRHLIWLALIVPVSTLAADTPNGSSSKPGTEHTCFQTSQPFNAFGDIGSDVAIVYGIGHHLPERIQRLGGNMAIASR